MSDSAAAAAAASASAKGEAVPAWASKHILDSTNNNHSRCAVETPRRRPRRFTLSDVMVCVAGRTRGAPHHPHHLHTQLWLPRRRRPRQVTTPRPPRPPPPLPPGRRPLRTWRPLQPLPSGAAAEDTGSAGQLAAPEEDSVWDAAQN